MLGIGKSSPVAEYEAQGEIDRVYHEIRQTLRVTGVNLIFRTWAGHKGLLPMIWDAVRPVAETRAFESAADQVRIAAARAAGGLGQLDAASAVSLGESQAYHVQAALDLYHYVNPKLLVLAAVVRRALEGESGGREGAPAEDVERIERGFPARMLAMEMEDEQPDDERLREIFGDIQEKLLLPSINSDYRTLALWPDYLASAWSKLKPVVQGSDYESATSAVRELARTLTAGLPFSVRLTREMLEESGADSDQAVESAKTFERLLPGLILNIALFLQDWRTADELARSPFPAETRTVAEAASS